MLTLDFLGKKVFERVDDEDNHYYCQDCSDDYTGYAKVWASF